MADQDHPIYSMSKEEVLYHLLKKEHGYYKAIMEITRQETERLESEQPIAEIKSLLKKKKILLACINEIETALTPLKKYWQGKPTRDDFFSVQIKEELNLLNKLLKEILQLDLASQRAMESHMITLREKNKEIFEKNKIIQNPHKS